MSFLVGKRTSTGFLTFHEWLLTESIRPLVTNFGTNAPEFNNKAISKINIDNTISYETYFEDDSKLYAVQYANVHTSVVTIGFGVSAHVPKNEHELDRVKLSHNRLQSRAGLDIFNKVFYIIIQTIINLKKDIVFDSADKDLERIYNKLILNKYFNEELNNIGYSNLSKDGDRFISKYIKGI